MNGKWIKSALILALLLISMVSLSTAAAIRTTHDTYVTQCGEVLSIGAPGVLGNDVGTGLYVEDAGSIALDKPNTGELEVHADGSFVFTAPVNAPGGLITGFYYNATDGTDSARSSATIEFTSCNCQPPSTCVCTAAARPITLCEGTQTPGQIEANITAAASCTGANCDGAPVIDFPAWETDEDELVIGGPYTYTVTCPSTCQVDSTATGTVTLVARCQLSLPEFDPNFICGEIEATLRNKIDALVASGDISCTGDCDSTPLIAYSGAVYYPSGTLQEITVKFTCASPLPNCGDTISLLLTCEVPTCTCDAYAPDIKVPCRTTLAQFKTTATDLIDCSIKPPYTACDATPVPDFSGVTVVGGFVTGGSYTVTCQYDLPECKATGKVTVGPCTCCVAKAVPLCGCLTMTNDKDDILDILLARGGGCFDQTTGKRCDETPVIGDSNVNYNKVGKYTYTVTCSGCNGVPSVKTNVICMIYPKCGPNRTNCVCPLTHCPTCIA